MGKYNGWSNRATWLINLHFNPETVQDLDYIREDLEEQARALPEYMRDLVDLDIINWQELEDSLKQ